MKITSKKTLHYFAIMFLMAMPIVSNNNCFAEAKVNAVESAPTNINECIKKFLNLEHDSELPFTKWADRFLDLIKNDPKYKNFKDLLEEYKKKSANSRLQMAKLFQLKLAQSLMIHKNSIDASTQDYIKKNISKLSDILRTRLGK